MQHEEDLAGSTTSIADLPSSTLPSWIPDLSGASFVMIEHENKTAGERMARQNADPLVGMPGDEHRSYAAAESKPVSEDKLRWRNKGRYYSMFVEGFLFDEIKTQKETSRAGLIPETWLEIADWDNLDDNPPEPFWRTLVADRGPHGQNTLSFYPRACKLAMKKAHGGVLHTSRVIEHGQSSIIAEFLHRVQAVIWNRRLIRTKNGNLGLVHRLASKGDRIAILYGCSVPVVLRRVVKSQREISTERAEAEADLEAEVRDVTGRFRKNIRDRKERRAALQVDWMDWTVLRFVWFIALLAFIKSRLKLNMQQAIIVNSPFLLFPQLLKSLQPSLNEQAWARIRHWLQYGRLTFIILLALLVASWLNLGFWERIAFMLSTMVLLPSLLLPDEQYRYIYSGAWVSASFHKSVRYLLPENIPEMIVPGPAPCYWRLIGECYIDGMMDGEAITYQSHQHIRPEVFELR